jgi:hypothetical protein
MPYRINRRTAFLREAIEHRFPDQSFRLVITAHALRRSGVKLSPKQTPRPHGQRGRHKAQSGHDNKISWVIGKVVAVIETLEQMHNGDQAEDCPGCRKVSFHSFARLMKEDHANATISATPEPACQTEYGTGRPKPIDPNLPAKFWRAVWQP